MSVETEFTERSEEAQVVEQVLVQNLDDLSTQDLEEVTEIVNNTVSSSIESVVSQVGSIELNLGSGKVLTVEEIDDLESVSEVMTQEILGGSDLDSNGVDDRLQLAFDYPFEFVELGVNEDGLTMSDQISWGVTELPEKPTAVIVPDSITNLGDSEESVVTVGGNFLVRAVGQPGDEIEVYLVDVEDHDNRISIVNGLIDESGKAAIAVDFEEIGVEEGSYYVVVDGDEGVGEVSEIRVDYGDAMDSPSIVMSEVIAGYEVEDYLYASVLLASDNSEDIDDDGDRLKVITGYAEPGNVVFVTWKSVIVSSVVISDASQGKFELEVPDVISEGELVFGEPISEEHQVLVYTYDPEGSVLSNISTLFFSN